MACALLALRAGLAMRRRRLRGAPHASGLLRRHLALAKPAVVLVLIGFAAGPISAVRFRGWEPFDSLHALLGGLAASLFAAAAWMGRSLERRRGGNASTHGALGLVAVLFAALAAMAGFVLLP
ncbi:MAG: hypothetical protein JRG96_06500 [Deltaproteobacteria bacterium]|nr:hypothetical protein [Deltaproteobacteria bacterium]